MLEELKARVCKANLDLVKHGLVVQQVHALKDKSAVATSELCKLVIRVVLYLRVAEINFAEGGLIHTRKCIQQGGPRYGS